jgi:hypothetical protein
MMRSAGLLLVLVLADACGPSPEPLDSDRCMRHGFDIPQETFAVFSVVGGVAGNDKRYFLLTDGTVRLERASSSATVGSKIVPQGSTRAATLRQELRNTGISGVEQGCYLDGGGVDSMTEGLLLRENDADLEFYVTNRQAPDELVQAILLAQAYVTEAKL